MRDHLDEVCVRVEHHRTITIREATYARRFKRVCRKMRTWLWLVGLKKVSKPSRCMPTCPLAKTSVGKLSVSSSVRRAN